MVLDNKSVTMKYRHWIKINNDLQKRVKFGLVVANFRIGSSRGSSKLVKVEK